MQFNNLKYAILVLAYDNGLASKIENEARLFSKVWNELQTLFTMNDLRNADIQLSNLFQTQILILLTESSELQKEIYISDKTDQILNEIFYLL